MVQLKTASVLFLLLTAACLSTARLNPGAEVNAISTLQASTEESKKVKSHNINVAILFGHGMMNSNKMVVEPQVIAVRDLKGTKNRKSSPSSEHSRRVEISKRSLRSRLSVDVVDKGFVAFSADYHAPRHHPPKNN